MAEVAERVQIPSSVSGCKKRLAAMNRELKAMDQGAPVPRDFAVEYEYLRQYQAVMEMYGEMCERLRECATRHKLGLGGEHLDRLVIEAVDDDAAQIATLETALHELIHPDNGYCNQCHGHWLFHLDGSWNFAEGEHTSRCIVRRVLSVQDRSSGESNG